MTSSEANSIVPSGAQLFQSYITTTTTNYKEVNRSIRALSLSLSLSLSLTYKGITQSINIKVIEAALEMFLDDIAFHRHFRRQETVQNRKFFRQAHNSLRPLE
jgi:hypothetical protein